MRVRRPIQLASAGKICVAVLEPEVQGDLPLEEKKSLSAAIERALTESLNADRQFTLVDRQSIDQVLEERKTASGTRFSADTVSAGLKPFWAAGVLVCARLDSKTQNIAVEAVSAQSGQLLASLYVEWQRGSPADAVKRLSEKARTFPRGIARAPPARGTSRCWRSPASSVATRSG